MRHHKKLLFIIIALFSSCLLARQTLLTSKVSVEKGRTVNNWKKQFFQGLIEKIDEEYYEDTDEDEFYDEDIEITGGIEEIDIDENPSPENNDSYKKKTIKKKKRLGRIKRKKRSSQKHSPSPSFLSKDGLDEIDTSFDIKSSDISAEELFSAPAPKDKNEEMKKKALQEYFEIKRKEKEKVDELKRKEAKKIESEEDSEYNNEEEKNLNVDEIKEKERIRKERLKEKRKGKSVGTH